MVGAEGIGAVDLVVGCHPCRKGRGKDGAPSPGFALHPRGGGSASLRFGGTGEAAVATRVVMSRSGALLVSSLMVQSISLWGCAVLGGGGGKAPRLALSPNRHRGSKLARFAGAGGEPLAYS